MRYLTISVLLLISFTASAQTTIKQDAAIEQMVNEVFAKNIETNIRKLVSFKTRHTLSDTSSRTEGSGAARNWKWDAPKTGKKPAGYYVLMRETISPYWEKKFYVTGTTATLAYSKDNYLFAVQSVDDEGHEGLMVFPKPLR